MTGYEFMGLHPFLTIVLALIVGMSITQSVDSISKIWRNDEQEQEDKS